jgi:predicted nucleic acid-binding protein
MRPKIYIETSILSYLAARDSDDIRVMANKKTTEEWWKHRRSQFDLFVSEFVIAEASLGDQNAARRRLEIIARIPEIEATEEVRFLGNALITEGAIPRNAQIDAYHIAIAAVNGIHYLLTWNCTHLANASMRTKIESVCRGHGYEPPIICTPQELMEDSYNVERSNS